MPMERQREILDEIGMKIGVTAADRSPWTSVSYPELIRMGGWKVLRLYGTSISAMLTAVYPEHQWPIMKFYRLKNKVTRDSECIRAFLDFAETELQMKGPEQWYHLTYSDLRKLGVYRFITQNEGIYNILRRYRPEYKWLPWKFNRIPKVVSIDKDSMNEIFDYLEAELKISKPEDWYSVTQENLVKLNVSWTISHQGGLFKLLKKYRPSYDWIPWKFSRLPKFVSSDPELINGAITYMESSLKIEKPEDWYRVTQEDQMKLGVLWSFRKRGGLYEVLNQHRPNFDWNPWQFNRLPKGTSRNPESIKAALEFVETLFKYEKPEDWYSVEFDKLKKLDIYWLLRKNGGLFNVLKKYRPTITWEPWKFTRLPREVARNPESIEAALSYVERSLSLTDPQDWYRVSTRQIRELGVYRFISQNGDLFSLLKRFRPAFQWNEGSFVGIQLFPKKLLGAIIRQLWPNQEVLVDYSIPNSEISVSYYLPNLKLALDFQSDSVYDVKGHSGQLPLRLIESPAKVSLSKQAGIFIVFVPFWWDKSVEALVGSIVQKVPEILDTMLLVEGFKPGNPIPSETVVEISAWKKRVLQPSKKAKRSTASNSR